jgi:hypothetical protein
MRISPRKIFAGFCNEVPFTRSTVKLLRPLYGTSDPANANELPKPISGDTIRAQSLVLDFDYLSGSHEAPECPHIEICRDQPLFSSALRSLVCGPIVEPSLRVSPPRMQFSREAPSYYLINQRRDLPESVNEDCGRWRMSCLTNE